MTVKYGKFEMPHKITVDEKSVTNTFARFLAEPFERGFGHTIGNSLRRMMLASIEAPAIIAIRFEGIPHEYMAVEGIVEDMTNIILNMKGALLRRVSTDEHLSSREHDFISVDLAITQEILDAHGGKCAVTLGDLVHEGTYEVV